MMASLPHLRYERKFLPDGLSLAAVLALIRRHPALFREVYPPRFVNNVYLDSPSRRDYLDHVNGACNRAKTRIRWYGPLTGRIGAPVLERKFKRGQVSGKLCQALPAMTFDSAPLERSLGDTLGSAPLPDGLRTLLATVEPALVNRYRRLYFQSADRRFRLTVDADLEIYAPHWTPRSMPPKAPPGAGVILELKYDPACAASAPAVANGLPFRVARCSKYVLGLQRCLGAA